jgi:hypothetical protein
MKLKNIHFKQLLKANLKWVLLIFAGALINLVVVLLTYQNGIGLGDGSTFYQFARNLAEGEVYYQDFIHFRTPGSYVLYSLFIGIIGDSFANLQMGILFESRVLYPVIFILALRVLFRGKYFWAAVASSAFLMVLPEYAQVRTVLAFLAVAFLTRALVDKQTINKKLLAVSGIVTAIAFLFGQETGFIAGSLSVVSIALLSKKSQLKIKEVALNYIWYGAGFIIGILPLVGYAIFHGELINFLYYTFYYAFILQPQHMDLPFPEFGYKSIVYYLPFVLVLLMTLVLYSLKDFRQKATMGILIGFVTLRLVTLVGRTDVGHLIFVIPELVLLASLAYWMVKVNSIGSIIVSRNLIIAIVTTGLIFAWIVTGGSSAALILAATVIMALFLLNIRDKVYVKIDKTVTLSVLFSVLTLLLFLLLPQVLSELKGIKISATRVSEQSLKLDGSFVDTETYSLLTQVEEAVKKNHPKTLFSYPIQPYFYKFADRHATPFITYEPQTTVQEQEITIEHLKITKPEVVLTDPSQASGLSGSLWLINEYVFNNYEVTEIVHTNQIIWVMEPRAVQVNVVPFVMTKYFKQEQGLLALQSPDKNLINGIIFPAAGDYSIDLGSEFYGLTFQFKPTVKGSCTALDITYANGLQAEDKICGEETYDLRQSKSAISNITFKGVSESTLIVNNFLLRR